MEFSDKILECADCGESMSPGTAKSVRQSTQTRAGASKPASPARSAALLLPFLSCRTWVVCRSCFQRRRGEAKPTADTTSDEDGTESGIK